MKTLVVSVMLVLAASPLRAEEGRDSEELTSTRIEASILRGIYLGTFFVHAYDARTSLNVIALGGRELDPLLRNVATHGPAFIVVNLARAAAIDVGVHAIAKRHRVGAIVVGAAINSGFLVIAAHNRDVAAMLRGSH